MTGAGRTVDAARGDGIGLVVMTKGTSSQFLFRGTRWWRGACDGVSAWRRSIGS